MRKGIVLFLALSCQLGRLGFSGSWNTPASVWSMKETGFKRLATLFAVASLLSSVFSYAVQAQGGDPGFNSPPDGASPQAQIDFYEQEIQQCEAYIDELSVGINVAEILFNRARKKYPAGFSGWTYSKRITKLEDETRLICNRIERIYKRQIEEAKAKLSPRKQVPIPTPTKTKRKKSSDDLKKKSVEKYNDEIKFINDYRKKLKEIKTGADKVFKEIDDLFKKTFPNKPIPRFKAETTTRNGLSTTTFTTPYGRTIINLPTGIQAGDTISGTVIREPSGRTEEERRANDRFADTDIVHIVTRSQSDKPDLESYRPYLESPKVDLPTLFPTKRPLPKRPPILDDTVWRLPLKKKPLKGTKIPTKEVEPGGMFRFEIADERVISALISGNSRAVLSINDGQKTIPIEIIQLALTPVESVVVSYPKQPGSPWESPNYVQAGRSIPIVGPFDGDAKNTSLELDGKPLTVLAESPRGIFFHLPTQTIGQHEIRIKELGQEARIPYRILKVGLSAPKTDLMRGEKTTVTIEVGGLNNLMKTEIIPLQLVSHGVINMDGGDSQSLRIRKKDVDANGVFRTTRKVTGLRTGGWGVNATVIDPRQTPIFVPLIRNSKGNGFRQKPDKNKAGFFEIRNVRDPRTGKRLKGNHKLETGCGNQSMAKKPQLLSLNFKKGNSGHAVIGCSTLVTPRIIIRNKP